MRKQSEVNNAAIRVCADGIALPRGRQPEWTMSTLSSAAGRPAQPGAADGLIPWIEAGAQVLLAYLDRRAAVKTLRGLDDRALRDIGISRCEIEAAVGGALNPAMGKLR
jgi:uncharacterized protein YjiS (DUF1127 family)